MNHLPGSDEAAERLKRTVFRDFGPPPETGNGSNTEYVTAMDFLTDSESGTADIESRTADAASAAPTTDPTDAQAPILAGVAAEGMLRALRDGLARQEVPVPRLLRYALELIDLKSRGPSEKVEWWVTFGYKGHVCELSHEKFGVRLRMWTDLEQAQAERTLAEISKKCRSSTRTVEKVILAAAPGLLAQSEATVINQHLALTGRTGTSGSARSTRW